jgi:hypothetical protein
MFGTARIVLCELEIKTSPDTDLTIPKESVAARQRRELARKEAISKAMPKRVFMIFSLT